MYKCNGVPVTIRKVPRASAKATPNATVILSPHWLIVPVDTSVAFIATAIREGSAMVVARKNDEEILGTVSVKTPLGTQSVNCVEDEGRYE